MKRLRALVAGVALFSVTIAAFAQRLDPRVPQTLVVGAPSGPSPTLRGDGARRGRAPHVPGSPRIAWRKELAQGTPVPPVVRASGEAIVLTGAAEVIELDATGGERTRFKLSSATPSSASLLSDDALLVATGNREMVLVRAGAVVRLVRVGDDRDGAAARRPAGALVTSILPLDDGGAVVAFDEEILAVDRDARIRARALLPAPIRGPLVADRDAVLATVTSGSVVAWKPGAEVRRVGRIAASLLGPVVESAPGTLVGIAEGPTLMRFDVARAASTVLVSPPAGTLLGPPSATADGALLFLSAQAGRTALVEVDPSGREKRRLQVSVSGAADAGAGGVLPLLSDVLVDGEGRVAFATPEGTTGVVDRDGTVRTLGEVACRKGRGSVGAAPPVGLVGTPRGFLVACDNGILLSIED